MGCLIDQPLLGVPVSGEWCDLSVEGALRQRRNQHETKRAGGRGDCQGPRQYWLCGESGACPPMVPREKASLQDARDTQVQARAGGG